jgi:tRNA dimethylallyltransferase
MSINKPKIIAIMGPTASGKSDLAVNIALFINKNSKKLGVKGAEIISADSRQVYKWLDIGSNKITKNEMRGVCHHLLSVTSPKKTFTVAQYQKLATKTIDQIAKNKKIPILCGGTGFYIDSVIYGIQFPDVKPNKKIRDKLEKISAEELLRMLEKKDHQKAAIIDKYNKRRLIRALEIVLFTKKPVPLLKKELKYKALIIGVAPEKKILVKKIAQRLDIRLKKGLVKEVSSLHKTRKLSWKRLESFGLEYRFIAQFLEDKISRDEMIKKIISESLKYTKRQMTWFNRNKSIVWILNKKLPTMERIVFNFLVK